MQINAREYAPLLLFFILGLVLVISGFLGTTGLMLASLMTPEFLIVDSLSNDPNSSSAAGTGENGSGAAANPGTHNPKPSGVIAGGTFGLNSTGALRSTGVPNG